MNLFGAILVTVLLGASPAAALDLRVVNGDTLVLKGKTIRLWGIEAPELGQQCLRDGDPWYPGPEAAEALKRIVAPLSRLDCETMDKDRLGRHVAICRGGGIDIGDAMVRKGWAFDYRRYSGGTYADTERKARQRKRGVWTATCVKPWQWRHPK